MEPPSPEAATRHLRALTTLVALIATILLGWVLTQAASILQPLVIAILLCNVLGPLVRHLKRLHVPPWVTVVFFTALLCVGAWQGGQLLLSEARAFVAAQSQQGTGAPAGGIEVIRRWILDNLREAELPQPVIDAIIELDPKGPVIDVLTRVGDFSRGFLLVVLYMLFLFAEQNSFRRKILSIAEHRSEAARNVLESIGLGIQRYLSVKTVVSFATGVLCYIGLLWMDIPYALLFGFVTFLLNYIPTFGSIAASILPVLSGLALHGPGTALIVAAIYLTVNTSLGSILEPRLLGRELNLSPLVILVSVVVWAGLWGVTGTFLAVPLTASLQIVLANIESTRPLAVLISGGVPRVVGRIDDEDDGAPARPKAC